MLQVVARYIQSSVQTRLRAVYGIWHFGQQADAFEFLDEGLGCPGRGAGAGSLEQAIHTPREQPLLAIDCERALHRHLALIMGVGLLPLALGCVLSRYAFVRLYRNTGTRRIQISGPVNKLRKFANGNITPDHAVNFSFRTLAGISKRSRCRSHTRWPG
jgi:hypothetical protein